MNATTVNSAFERANPARQPAGTFVEDPISESSSQSRERTDQVSLRTRADADIDVLAKYGDVALAMENAVCERLPAISLGRAPSTDQHKHREHLAEICRDSYQTLGSIYQSWQDFLENLIAANIVFEQLEDTDNAPTWATPSMVDDIEQKAAALRARKARVAIEELATKVLQKDLRMPPFPLVARPWFTHERLEARDIGELHEEAPLAFRQMAAKAVNAFLEVINTGLEGGIFGSIHAGRHSTQYSFCTHLVSDKLQREVISEDADEDTIVGTKKGTRTTSRVVHSHELLHPVFCEYEPTLNNPNLVLPPHFRRLLENVPRELRPHLTSVFGMQITELACARDIDSQEITEQRVIARALSCEPCVVFAGHTVLFGWGKEIMDQTSKLYSEHRAILDAERKHLDAAARAQGGFWTTLRFGIGLLVLIAVEAVIAIKVGSIASTLYLFPICVFAAAAVYFAICRTRSIWKHGLSEAKKVIEAGFEQLTNKYPSFDPNKPHLPRPDELDDQQS